MARSWRASVAVVLFLTLWTQPVQAENGEKPVAFGAEAAGRGGVDYAYGYDATAAQTNPAGMAFTGGQRLDLVSSYGLPGGYVASNSRNENVEPSWVVVAPYQMALRIDPNTHPDLWPAVESSRWTLDPSAGRAQDGESEPWRVGIGMFTDDNTSFVFRHVFAGVTASQPTLQASNEQLYSVGPTFSFRIPVCWLDSEASPQITPIICETLARPPRSPWRPLRSAGTMAPNTPIPTT